MKLTIERIEQTVYPPNESVSRVFVSVGHVVVPMLVETPHLNQLLSALSTERSTSTPERKKRPPPPPTATEDEDGTEAL